MGKTKIKAAKALSLSALQCFALKIAGEKEAKPRRGELVVKPGQTVDFCVRIKGAIDVGSRGMQNNNEKPDLLDLLSVIFNSLGQRQRHPLYLSIVAHYKAGDAKTPTIVPAAKEFATDLLEELTVRSVTATNGKVTGALSVELLRAEAAA